MSYVPPPEPQRHPTPAGQPWTDPHGRGWPGGPPPVEPPKGAGVAAVALVLGIIGCRVWLLPVNLDRIRAYSPLPFALLGFVLAVVALNGRRRGKPMAAIGAVLCCLGLLFSLILITLRS
ncbi:hypothetical protein E1263_10190 [Kribbella antibiotica]|uniref:DUF4190 domain-containing protein n=1 Tax=Kribbella antibiotica TaxID=190195 RepID=A0A4R4ZP37_9ACTN|nr:hypothetical protein [Kribbella antibiotica]TDD60643.1 hypothetical protein E1263_10190 [Kribbella antibiotica]